MPLPTPGNVTPMPATDEEIAGAVLPAATSAVTAPPLPGTPDQAMVAPSINPAFHQPPGEVEDAAVIEVLGPAGPSTSPPLGMPAAAGPAPDVAGQVTPAPPPVAEVYAQSPGVAVQPVVQDQAVLPQAPGQPPVYGTEPALPVQGTLPLQPTAPAQVPQAPVPSVGTSMTATGGILGGLQEEGFDGLEMGFGAFPTVKLQGETFSTSEEESLGNTFACVIHGSRKKYFLKCKDSQDAEEFVYTYDKQVTSGGKPIADILQAWAEKGWTKPVWKEYLDVTAQIVEIQSRSLGKVVLLSIPKTSNARLTGYLTTLKVGQGLSPSEVITQIYPGQKITSVKFPFHPWAFKQYIKVVDFIV